MKLDLGCGDHKHTGFFGIDRVGGTDVDLVCDFNYGIRLPENSVEFIMASRSLPYASDLFSIMSDLYRVSIHKAIICILAPYAHHYRHMSNPYLKQKFDEYTPRYLTNHFLQPPDSPICPPVPSYTGYSVPFDFRLLRMELFYEQPFVSPMYEPDELDMLKHLQPNVVSEIMYHFVVIKKDLPLVEWDWMSKQSYPEPLWVPSLRPARPSEEPLIEQDKVIIPAAVTKEQLTKPPRTPKTFHNRKKIPRKFL
ncbi:hypothetical protein LOZ80_21850 [Paenibacillus sp. HWE-109]|uniref:hypothetical protein n=1 Tax=Paenibacillus sp. HWE-109 TaxID=1306526 RepID=UPI001EDCDD4D|nr:hypothetical protein [Paenibacillus sp. HWE-109]UKS24266.1 hypothetical protein LOZ80_21850 [Paenibacillus sp. HWE-109]